ncbi:response regulator [Marinomonas sp. S3726]|jgi:CheY-like chemotaxis protein|uniref:response regulator n=1 Tax=Marinomonas sp. S3726 TaxID=579484 RepID=UPI0005F9D2F6|nr:response regulator [Marinomonas sp. S3726]KJZ15671.1 response regulator [Marinomonas sp. S3726]
MAIKILVVDDASFTRDLIRRTLKKHFPSAQLEEAVNGRKAQQLMNKVKFDMILCDWEMPEMTGLELLDWCRQQDNYKKENVPFVMITSRGDKDHVVEAVKTGVTDYLGKPFSSEQLVNKIVSAAKKHNLDGALMAKGARGSGAEKEVLDSLTKAATGSGTKGMTSHTSGSLDVLLGGKSPKAATVTKPKITHPKVTTKDVKVPSMVRFAGKQFRTMVIQFSCTEASLLIKSDDVIPSVLDQAVLDLEFKGKVNRLNYYVQGVATTEKKPTSSFLTVTLGLIDQDAEKESFIKALFESL